MPPMIHAARVVPWARACACAWVLAGGAGCLDPLVKDSARTSTNLLPPGTAVPSVTTNAALKIQVSLNDGLDDRALAASNNVITRGSGASAGGTVRFWNFGPMTRAPSPLYLFYQADGTTPLGGGQLPLVDALPGDPAYSGVHSLVKVAVTAAYAGELITSSAALADAIELGLIADPVPMGLFQASPMVVPDGDGAPKLQVSDPMAGAMPTGIDATPVFGRGYVAGMFPLGGAAGIQPGAFILPTMQASFLRDPKAPTYDATRPIFQATVQTATPPPPGKPAAYSPLTVILDVDLKASGLNIQSDSELFDRNAASAIVAVHDDKVQMLQITSTVLLLPLQFVEGQP